MCGIAGIIDFSNRLNLANKKVIIQFLIKVKIFHEQNEQKTLICPLFKNNWT